MIGKLVDISANRRTGCIVYIQSTVVSNHEQSDNSVLTKADLCFHNYICEELKNIFLPYPLFQKNQLLQYSYEERKTWEYFF